jgi:NADPH:quinone reductase-like Zn-dependent oxidoreductase
MPRIWSWKPTPWWKSPTAVSWEERPGSAFPSLPRDGRPAPFRDPKAGETVLVRGVNGKVGQAATQIASWHGADVIGVVRKSEPYAGHANAR